MAGISSKLCSWMGAIALTGVIAGSATAAPLHAQDTKSPFRLTVRPHEMKLGERNEAGQRRLNSKETQRLDFVNGAFGYFPVLAEDSVHVPASAVGKKRVPLLAVFSLDMATWRPFADHYGVVLLGLAETWSETRGDGLTPAGDGVQRIDDALHQVLSDYAIDPDRIAIVGMSNGADLSVLVGCENLDVFSQIGLMSPIPADYTPCAGRTQPQAKRTQFFLNTGSAEDLRALLEIASRARTDGHPVELVLTMRGHMGRAQDRGDLMQWLAGRWGLPQATKAAKVDATGDTVLPLTIDGLAKMTAFWTSFRKNHPFDTAASIKKWPLENRKTIVVPVGADRMNVFEATDLRAMAGTDSSVARLLQGAGLTFAQEEAYRIALISTHATLVVQEQFADLPPAEKVSRDSMLVHGTPSVERNVAFFRGHKDAAEALLAMLPVP